MRWKREICPPLPVFAVHAIAALEAPDHGCDIEGDQECDEENEYHHGLFFLSCFYSMQYYTGVFQHMLGYQSFLPLLYPKKKGAPMTSNTVWW